MSVYEHLVKKLDILNKIYKNTETQLRFVRRHEMRGLQRLLRERAKYLHQLTMLNVTINACDDEPATEAISTLCQQIRMKEQEISACNTQTMQAAAEERDNLAASLRNVRQGRHLHDHYQSRGHYAGGSRFNKKI